MATYSYQEPVQGVFQDPASEVRFLVNDTSPAAPDSLTDDEVHYLLAQAGDDRRQAAAAVARRMAGRFARRSGGVASKSVNGLSLTYNYADLAQSYRALADELAAGTETGGTGVSAIWTGDDIAGVFDQGSFDNRQGGAGFPW